MDNCTVAVDLVILLDGSGSVNDGNFESVTKAVVNFLESLSPSRRDQPLLLNIVQFSRRQREEFSGVICTDAQLSTACVPWTEASDAIRGLSQVGGASYTWSALDFVVKETAPRSFRRNTHKILITITDGLVNSDDPLPSSGAIRAASRLFDQMIAVSVGNDIDKIVLEKLGNGRFKNVSDYNALQSEIVEVTEELCIPTFYPGCGRS